MQQTTLYMFGFAFGYVLLVWLTVNRVVRFYVRRKREDVIKAQTAYQDLIERSGSVYAEMKKLSERTSEIFTLYEMTREITKSFDEEVAFPIFKEKLKENVRFAECLLLDPESDKPEELEKSGDYFLFSLRGKKRLLGTLAIKGLPKEDRETFMILAHQFALVLRRIRLYQEVEKLATTDSLTELRTRRSILDHLQEEIKRSQARKLPMSFVMIDVDYFKKVNDQHGHLTGDQVLREIARIIRESIREIDVAGRYGGEEFCVILPDTDRKGARYVADRIRTAVAQTTITAYDTQVNTTVSIGLATFPHDAREMTELLDKADWALYRSKKNGRNMVCSFGAQE